MNKKISELAKLLSLELNDVMPISDVSSSETKHVTLEDLQILFDSTRVGDVKMSMLTPSQFNDIHLGNWLLINGQSCVGTAYASLTGNTNVPDAVSGGMFFRQAIEGRALGSSETDSVQGHGHNLYVGNTAAGFPHPANANQIALADNAGSRSLKSTQTGSQDIINNLTPNGAYGTPRVSDETRPKNIAINYFIRVN